MDVRQPSSTLTIAIAQLNPTIGDLSGNARGILQAAHQAQEQGAELLLTPELSLCGYPPRDLLLNPGFVEAIEQTLGQLAAELPPDLAVLVGTVEVNPRSRQQGGKPLFNSTALLYQGQAQQIFHKRLLPTYDVFDEDRYFEPGWQPNILTLPLPAGPPLRIGVTICEDVWNEEEFWGQRTYSVNPTVDLTQQDVDLIVNLSASPFSVGKQRLRESMLHYTATRYDQPLIYTNQVGGNDDLLFDGSSMALNRQGEVVCRAAAFATDLVWVQYDRARQDLLPSRIAPLPDSDEAEIWAALVLGVRDYARKCGFRQAVIGLSGGIDSSLVAAIAAAALGAEHVLGVLMPSPYSSKHSIQDALTLAENLGIRTQTLPIGPAMEVYEQTLADLFAETTPGVAEENIQSRIRGNLLMAIANKFGYLVISTGNKSELAVGYCTLYGDMSGGLAAIADVPKTQVYALCRWLNSDFSKDAHSNGFFPHLKSKIQNPKSKPIPINVLEKAPSAELKPGQVDQDSLPPYEILDDILYRLIDQHQPPRQIVEAGHAPAVVERVVQMVTRAEFKRRQAPPGLKITDRAFGVGWRMPIAARLTGWIAAPLADVAQPQES